MKKVLVVLMIIMISVGMIGCGEKDSGIDWYNKIQKKSVVDSYLEETCFNTNIAIMENETNALLTIVMGLREGLFDFSEEDFNKAMDKHIYYSDEVRFSKVCDDMDVDIRDYLGENKN